MHFPECNLLADRHRDRRTERQTVTYLASTQQIVNLFQIMIIKSIHWEIMEHNRHDTVWAPDGKKMQKNIFNIFF